MQQQDSSFSKDSSQKHVLCGSASLVDSGSLGLLPEGAARQNQSGASSPPSSPPKAGALAGDILYGADTIAEFVYGSKIHRRKVYNLIETNRLPHFRLGMIICSRKSVLLAWIAEQEQRPMRPDSECR